MWRAGLLPTLNMRGSTAAPVHFCTYVTPVNDVADGLVPLLAQMCAMRKLYKRCVDSHRREKSSDTRHRPINGASTDGRTWVFVRLLENGYWLSSDTARPVEVLHILRRWVRGDVPAEWMPIMG
jgi:hypothetical protein